MAHQADLLSTEYVRLTSWIGGSHIALGFPLALNYSTAAKAPQQTWPQADNVCPSLIWLTLYKITIYDNKHPGKPLIALHVLGVRVEMGTLFEGVISLCQFRETLTSLPVLSWITSILACTRTFSARRIERL